MSRNTVSPRVVNKDVYRKLFEPLTRCVNGAYVLKVSSHAQDLNTVKFIQQLLSERLRALAVSVHKNQRRGKRRKISAKLPTKPSRAARNRHGLARKTFGILPQPFFYVHKFSPKKQIIPYDNKFYPTNQYPCPLKNIKYYVIIYVL